jgi:hypothetical protein
MNKQTFSIFATGLILFLSSCKKTDLQDVTPSEEVTSVTVADASAWKSVGSWVAGEDEKTRTAGGLLTKTKTVSGVISDSSITPGVFEDGLVLVYKKTNGSIKSLPLEENGVEWYYQVSENGIEINGDGVKSDDQITNHTFQYFVVSASRVAELEAAGQTRSELMKLSHENATALLKK